MAYPRDPRDPRDHQDEYDGHQMQDMDAGNMVRLPYPTAEREVLKLTCLVSSIITCLLTMTEKTMLVGIC
jgi:hypothetical protein